MASMTSIITPSDVIHLHVIYSLIKLGSQNHDAEPEESALPFSILCLLGELLEPPKSRQYTSFADFENVMDSLGDTLDDKCRIFLQGCVSEVEAWESLEDLMNFFDGLNDIFWSEERGKEDMNRLSSPSCIMPDSFLGTYVRACIARWGCMDFNATCIVYEECLAFSKGRAADANTYSAFSANESSSKICNLEPSSALGVFPTSDQQGSAPSSSSSRQEQHTEPTLYLLSAHRALLREDYKVAEDFIHSYFDFGDKNLISDAKLAAGHALASAGDMDAMPEKAYLTALDNLMSAAKSTSSHTKSRSRHQMALVALVSMWVAGGHSTIALKGIDEGMKISHQRGDHAAVTETLLLLHMIHEGEEFSTDVRGSLTPGVNDHPASATPWGMGGVAGQHGLAGQQGQSEEVLQRCLRRCRQYNLKSLALQASLVLAGLRARALASRTRTVLTAVNGPRGSGSRSGAAASMHDLLEAPVVRNIDDRYCSIGIRALVATTHTLWKLAAVAMYGDLPLLVRVASAGQSDEEEAGTNGAGGGSGRSGVPGGGYPIPGGGAAAGAPFPGGPGNVPGGSSGGNTDKDRAEAPLSRQESLQFLAQHTALMVGLWRRVGLPEMADLQARRTLRAIDEELRGSGMGTGRRTAGTTIGDTDCVEALCSWAEARAELLYLRCRGGRLPRSQGQGQGLAKAVCSVGVEERAALEQCLRCLQAIQSHTSANPSPPSSDPTHPVSVSSRSRGGQAAHYAYSVKLLTRVTTARMYAVAVHSLLCSAPASDGGALGKAESWPGLAMPTGASLNLHLQRGRRVSVRYAQMVLSSRHLHRLAALGFPFFDEEACATTAGARAVVLLSDLHSLGLGLGLSVPGKALSFSSMPHHQHQHQHQHQHDDREDGEILAPGPGPGPGALLEKTYSLPWHLVAAPVRP